MPIGPKPSAAPHIRSALKLYRVTSIITGTFLLLLCLMMVFRYLWPMGDIELNGAYGFLYITPQRLVKGVDISTLILILHGWFYVLYLFSDFRLWSVMRWNFVRFIIVALGGVVPFLSFIVERHYHRVASAELEAILAKNAEPGRPVEASHQ
jgi:integral membrane protein